MSPPTASRTVAAAALRRHLARRAARSRVGHERLGLAVLDDVGGLVAGQVPVDRGEAEARPAGGVEHLDELGPVGAHERDGVAGAEARGGAGRAPAGWRWR